MLLVLVPHGLELGLERPHAHLGRGRRGPQVLDRSVELHPDAVDVGEAILHRLGPGLQLRDPAVGRVGRRPGLRQLHPQRRDDRVGVVDLSGGPTQLLAELGDTLLGLERTRPRLDDLALDVARDARFGRGQAVGGVARALRRLDAEDASVQDRQLFPRLVEIAARDFECVVGGRALGAHRLDLVAQLVGTRLGRLRARDRDGELVPQLADVLLLDAVATNGARSAGARGPVEHLGDLLEPPLDVQARVTHALELEAGRVALAQRFEEALAVGLAELLPFGQLRLQRAELGREARGLRRGRAGGRLIRGRLRGRRRTHPPALLLRGAEARLRDEALVFGTLLGHLPSQRPELPLGLGARGGDLLERTSLRERDGARFGGRLRVGLDRGLELDRGLLALRRAGRDRDDLPREDGRGR